VADFRDRGYTAAGAGQLHDPCLGWSPPEGMAERFAWRRRRRPLVLSGFNRAGSPLRLDKLNWSQRPGAGMSASPAVLGWLNAAALAGAGWWDSSCDGAEGEANSAPLLRPVAGDPAKTASTRPSVF